MISHGNIILFSYPYSESTASRFVVAMGLKLHQLQAKKCQATRDVRKQLAAYWPRPPASSRDEILDRTAQIGNCVPLSELRTGTYVHWIECKPGQGAKLVRAAGSYAKVMKEPGVKCLVKLPSGVEKLIDSRCRATIGTDKDNTHVKKKLYKAGQSRWLGIRPHVRGVAMNPVDHPHGGGEGRTKGGRPSCSPWGKPTKCGYKSGAVKKKKANKKD
ncbi:hypothetical protein MKW94_015431 [Papaver nudicaule]|uniref:Large ribosomal subunit protein uL2m n=1 Tax=Papaver nudicaule TaxID=74823 RepID=A0AA41SRP5_PAPNU|nr:hypothetical protein [Papaver nudicaule]